MIHSRTIALSGDGYMLEGMDSFMPADGHAFPARADDEFAIRFHLHPAIRANRLADGHGVILLLPDRELWSFVSYSATVEVEESVFLAGPGGPRRTVQIVIYGHARDTPAVRWSFSYNPPAPAARQDRAAEPELPLNVTPPEDSPPDDAA